MRILIIDDDEIFCRLLVEILEASGIQAIWTTDGLNGYEMLTHADYDLCIIDVRMPLILGTELAEAIREDRPQAKIILASAFADEALQDYARHKGIMPPTPLVCWSSLRCNRSRSSLPCRKTTCPPSSPE